MNIIQPNILILGLGNYPEEYSNTPHNAGFMFLDTIIDLLRPLHITFKQTQYCKQKIIESDQYKLFLTYPQTFMNLSGNCFKEAIESCNFSSFVIAYDDLDIELGAFKITTQKNSRTHKGLLSLKPYLSKLEKPVFFVRLGVNTSRRHRFRDPSEYLTSPLKKSELQILKTTCQRAWMSLISPNFLDINNS